jgi:hypothetical protein
MENQHNEEHLSPEELAEKKEQMLEFYTDSLPYLDAQLVYEQKLLAIDEARFKRMSLQMQYAMMMNEAKNGGQMEEDDEFDQSEAEAPKRKLKNQVQKRVVMSKNDVIKYQILTHCYINRITMSESDLECLTLLSLLGPIELSHFCYEASDEHKIFKSEQTVRNCINKCEKNNLVSKDPVNKKVVFIEPSLKIQTEGDVLLDYKFLGK